MQKYVTEAIVLKNINYGDSHKFYSLLTKDHGKVSALAMGVRKISSRRAGNLDSLNHVTVSITENSKGFKTINEVKTVNSFKHCKTNLNSIYYAMKFTESVEYSIEQDHSLPEVFYLLLTALENLNSPEDPHKIIELWFLLGLSDMLGFKLDLDICAGCGNHFKPQYSDLSYHFESGGILCGTCAGYSLKMRSETYDLLNILNSLPLSELLKTSPSHEAISEVTTILNAHARNIYSSRKVGEKTDLLVG